MKKLLILISLFSVSCAFGMNPHASAGKQEEPEGYQVDSRARARTTTAPTSAAATIDEAEEQTIAITFADSENNAETESRPLQMKYANCSQTLNDLLSDFGGASATPIIPLPILAAEFNSLAPYWECVHQISIAPDEDHKEKRKAFLLAQLKKITNKTTLGTILNAANYLAIEPLVDCGLQAAHNQLLAEINFDEFMDEEALQNYNPYNLNHDLYPKLKALLVEPAAHFLAEKLASLYSTKQINYAEFSPDSKIILTISNENIAHLWDAESGKLLNTFENVSKAKFNPNGESLLIVTPYDMVELRDLKGNHLHEFGNIFLDDAFEPNFSPDGKTIFINESNIDHECWTSLYDLNGNCLHTIENASAVMFNPDGKTIILSYPENSKLVNIETAETIHEFEKLENHAEFHPNGKTLLLNNKLIDVETGNILHIFEENITDAKFHPNKNLLLATIEWGMATKLWDFEGNCLHTFERVYNAEFSRDGTMLLINRSYGTPELIDIKTGQCLNKLQGHLYVVGGCCFSPNNKIILTLCSCDQTVKLWDLKGNCINTLCDITGWVKESQKLKTKCTLPQANLLGYALHSGGINVFCRHNTQWQSVFNSFDPELKSFLTPLLETDCKICMANKRLVRNTVWTGAATTIGLLAFTGIQHNQQAISNGANHVFRVLRYANTLLPRLPFTTLTDSIDRSIDRKLNSLTDLQKAGVCAFYILGGGLAYKWYRG